MRFLVVGPGAMGCLFAARLKKSGHQVALLDYKPDRARLINEQGLIVEDESGRYTVRVPATAGAIEPKQDVVLICVKANQTAEGRGSNAHLPCPGDPFNL